MMAWDVKLGAGKCMGGWYDPYTTTPPTYLEQARQTILGGAKESMLFCYRALSEEQPGMEDTEALRAERPGLLKLAYLTETKKIVGVSVPKKPDVDAEEERYLSSFYGMLGIPVCPEVDLDAGAPSAILGAQALGFAGIRDYALGHARKGRAAGLLRGLPAQDRPLCRAGRPRHRSRRGQLEPDGHGRRGAQRAARPPDGSAGAAVPRAHARGAQPLRPGHGGRAELPGRAVQVELDLFGRDPKARKVALVLSEGREVGLVREGSRYALTIPPRTLVVLN